MKLRRFGIFSTSDGTLGLSRKKCTLSNVMLITCWIPFPSEHGVATVGPAGVEAAGAEDAVAGAGVGEAAVGRCIAPNIAVATMTKPTTPTRRARLDSNMNPSPPPSAMWSASYGAVRAVELPPSERSVTRVQRFPEYEEGEVH